MDNISKSEVQNSLYKSEVNISTSSSLYEHHSNARIGKDGRLKLSDWLIAQTVDEVPILKEETTFVDKLIPKRKNNSTKSESSKIVDEEIATTSDVKGILRPDYSNSNFDENLLKETSNDDVSSSSISIDYSFMTIIIGCILVMLIGIFISYFKNKQESDDSML